MIDITDIPYNRLIGITRDAASTAAPLQLLGSPDHLNHVNTIHACAQFSLAEAASGECLLRRFSDIANLSAIMPLLREVRVKYRRPATGTLQAKARFSDAAATRAIEALSAKGRALIPVSVDLVDEAGITTMTATFSWYVQMTDAGRTSIGGHL